MQRNIYLQSVLKSSDKDLHEFPTSVRSSINPFCFCENKFNIFQNWNRILNLWTIPIR